MKACCQAWMMNGVTRRRARWQVERMLFEWQTRRLPEAPAIREAKKLANSGKA